MLFTRCLHCNTTFRITAESLNKAGGRVRCGHCARIFNAYDELREGVVDRERGETRASLTPPPAGAEARAPKAQTPSAQERAAVPAMIEPHEALAEIEPREALAEIEPREALTRHEAAPETDAPYEPAEQRAEVDDEAAPILWLHDAEPEPARRSVLWRIGSAAALLALIAQTAHHFRAELAGQPVLGPALQSAYALVGTSLVPRWDLDQYQVVDWVAAAEPGSTAQSNLIITARIQNRGPAAQPYPHIHLTLKDRWESGVGSRTFSPEDYLVSDGRDGALMSPGDTARARLAIVDPGPDAYGFELDVCVEYEPEQLRCTADNVFR